MFTSPHIAKEYLRLSKLNLIIIIFFYKFCVLIPFNIYAQETILKKEKLNDLYNSIVSIHSKIPDEARTSKSLGTVRQGSGVVIDNKNILTIGYVVLEASEISIGLINGKKIPGRLIAYDFETGFGLVSPIVSTKLKSLKIGDSSKIKMDDSIFILPSPTMGIGSLAKMVSRRPFVGWWEYYLEKPIYTLPNNPAWTGAPLVNSQGEIVGIGSLFIRDAVSPEIISPGNMFVPINLLKPIMKDLVKYGRRTSNINPYIGLSSDDNSGKIVVTKVSKDGPSYKVGIKPDDVITGVNGRLVNNLETFYKTLWSTRNYGAMIKVDINRNGKKMSFNIRSINRMDYYLKSNSY